MSQSFTSPPASPPFTTTPSRKRQRTDVTPEQRREARAHRNRIAAQTSRDKKKAQFSILQARVAQLEEENRQLRLGIPVAPEVTAEQKLKEVERQRETEELRERVRELEKSWKAVLKALELRDMAQFPVPPAAVVAEAATTSSSPSLSFSLSSVPTLEEPTCHSAAGGAPLEFDFDIAASAHNTLTTPAPDNKVEDWFRDLLSPSPAPSLPTTVTTDISHPSSAEASLTSSPGLSLSLPWEAELNDLFGWYSTPVCTEVREPSLGVVDKMELGADLEVGDFSEWLHELDVGRETVTVGANAV